MKSETTRPLLLLGGSRQQVIAIEAAKDCGYRTVVCDYLPDNPGQHSADSFHLVSTTDREAILEVARKENIQGIIAYASDPAASTAAYVAERLGLPTNPLNAVETMSVKASFREHVRKAGLPCPRSMAVSVDTHTSEIARLISSFTFPLVVKPTDSSGSKGVSIVEGFDEMPRALDAACSKGRNGILIIEEYIEYGFPHIIGGDVFVRNGKIEFWGLMSCLRDESCPLIPVGEAIPSGLSEPQARRLMETLQTLVSSLDIRFGELNVELIIGKDGAPYIVELGARAGGNLIPVQLSDASNIDLVRANVMCAMGDDPGDIAWKPSGGCYATYVLHSTKNGIYQGYKLSQNARKACYRVVDYAQPGDAAEAFDGADKALGILFFRFPSENEMRLFLDNIDSHVIVRVA